MTFGELQKQGFAWTLTDREADEVVLFRASGEEFQATMLISLMERMIVLANGAGLSLDLLAVDVENKRKKERNRVSAIQGDQANFGSKRNRLA